MNFSSYRMPVGDLIRAIILISFAASSIALAVLLSVNLVPSPESFSYTETVSPTGQSLKIVNVNGGVVATPWQKNEVQINGTITATGSGARPEQARLEESDNGGNLLFQPVYPEVSAGRSYVVTVSVSFPSSVTFNVFEIATINGAKIDVTGLNAVSALFSLEQGTQGGSLNQGSIRLSSLNTKQLDLFAHHANVFADFAVIQSGGLYSFSLHDYGSLNLALPAFGGFRLESKIEGNSEGCGGSAGCVIQTSGFDQCHTDGPQFLETGTQMFNAACGDGSAFFSLNVFVGNVIISRNG